MSAPTLLHRHFRLSFVFMLVTGETGAGRCNFEAADEIRWPIRGSDWDYMERFAKQNVEKDHPLRSFTLCAVTPWEPDP